MFYWTASNNSSFLNGKRSSNTMRGAVRDARRYVDSELYGEGRITYSEDDCDIRRDEKSIFTKFQWETKLI